MKEITEMPKLEQWSQIYINGENCLTGYVYNDERMDKSTGKFSDGHRVITSALQEIDIDNNIARTRNTSYQLGESLISEEKITIHNFDLMLPKK